MPLFGAADAAPNKGTTILYWFRSPKTLLNPPANGKIQGLWVFFKYFLRQILFSRTFQDIPVYLSTFQAYAKPAIAFCCQRLWTGAQHSCENNLEEVQWAITESQIPPPLLQDQWRSCARSTKLHASEAWPLTKPNLLKGMTGPGSDRSAISSQRTWPLWGWESNWRSLTLISFLWEKASQVRTWGAL